MKKIVLVVGVLFSLPSLGQKVPTHWTNQSDLVAVFKNSEGNFFVKALKPGYEVDVVGGDNINPVRIRCTGNYDYVEFEVSTETNGATMVRSGDGQEPAQITNANSIRAQINSWKSFTLGKVQYDSTTNRLDLDTTTNNSYDILPCVKVISI